MTPDRPVIIANPHAGQKAGIKTNSFGPSDLQAVLARHGVEADLWLTERADHATELARQAVQEGRRLVIAAGGDGTIAETAEGLVDSEAALGVMPLGSIMNIARMLGIPRDLDRAAEVIAANHSVRIDAGRATTRVGQRLFLEAAGVGVSAALFAYTNQLDSGNWSSIRPLVKFLLRYRPRRLRAVVDGRVQQVRATMATIANGPYLGAGFVLAPGARLDDRRFTVRIFSAVGKLEMTRQVWAILRRSAPYQPGILTRQGRIVEIDGPRPWMVHADSHPLGTTPARFELLPAAISVLVPAQPECEPALLQVSGAAHAGRP
jgi:diacylglycerol kinase (ATP)